MESSIFEVGETREVPGYAALYSAWRRGEPEKWFEFLDAVDPGTPRSEKWVIMISSQFGCAVNCRFCDAGKGGYRGNLTVEELLAQIRYALSLHPELDPASVPKLKVHFARMGEPSLNRAVVPAIEHLGKSARLPGLMPSISTVAPRCPQTEVFFEGLKRIKDACFTGGRFQLQLSVHSTDEAVRRAIIPVRKWELAELGRLGKFWRRPGDRLITLNFALADDVPFDPAVLEKHFTPEHYLVKFTAVHTTRNAAENSMTRIWYEAPERISAFGRDLERRGFQVIINPCWPAEIENCLSCGQMADSVPSAAGRPREPEAVC